MVSLRKGRKRGGEGQRDREIYPGRGVRVVSRIYKYICHFLYPAWGSIDAIVIQYTPEKELTLTE
jgi:hypothetical protein